MRGKRAKKREQNIDKKYNSTIAAAFINKIMQGGKKSIAEKMFYDAVESAAKKVGDTPLNLLNKVIENISPNLEVRSRRVGGANYQIPIPVSPDRQKTLAIRWIVDSARGKSGKPFSEIFEKELVDAYNEQGDAFNKKINVEKMAEANKAFAHFRW
ncbi:MAG TPA: 30S ribosomal protein S7 [bacterium]|nr:30S ribosomal protein S7 [bacterium]